MNNWKHIWNNRQISDLTKMGKNELLSYLIKINGFDGGSGNSGITIEAWENYISFVKNKLSIQNNDSLFEVGCGCGAILYPFYSVGHTVGGIDYSNDLIKQAKIIMPNAKLIIGDASEIDNTQYDFVISNSIFFYFSDYEYSSLVINKMYEKARRGIAILDVPDLILKEVCENERRKQVSNYDEKYKGLEHLYYPKKWFLDFSEQNRCSALTLIQQNIEGYGYNNYRFNCFISK